jgi:hypothetical protein
MSNVFGATVIYQSSEKRDLTPLRSRNASLSSTNQPISLLPFVTSRKESTVSPLKSHHHMPIVDQDTSPAKFDLSKFAMPYNPNRLNHVDATNAIVDPNQTIRVPRLRVKRFDVSP